MARNFQRGEARMFKSDFIEFFSKVHPATPAVVYLPFVAFCLYQAIAVVGTPVSTVAWQFVAGYFIWTLTEYWLHRLLFHLPVKGPISRRIYFVLHGVHHEYPWDMKRLVMPLAASLMGAAVFFTLFALIFGVAGAWPWTAGFATGYVIYDTVHWYTHAGKPKSKLFKYLRREHMIHHFKESASSTRFGVSAPYWDYVFGTTGRQADTEDGRQSDAQHEEPDLEDAAGA